MLRKEYWVKSKEILAFCTDTELNVLAQQATKELNDRHNSYFKKMDATEAHKKKAKARKQKAKYKK